MNNNEITAAWARKQAESILGGKVEKELDEVLTLIKKSVSENKFELDTTKRLHELTRQELNSRGFKIKDIAGDPRDQRECDYIKITW